MDVFGIKGLLRLLRHESGFRAPELPSIADHAKTSFASTVFSGESHQWVTYLQQSRSDRYVKDIRIWIELKRDAQQLILHADNEASRTLAGHLETAFRTFQARVRHKPFVAQAAHEAIFENSSNYDGDLRLRVSHLLPCEASREVKLGHSKEVVASIIVLREATVRAVLRNLISAGRETPADAHLGLTWPLVRRLISQLSYPDYPRDRFVEKIALTERNCLIAVNLLFDEKRHQQLVPNKVGKLFQQFIAHREGIRESDLFERHLYFRLLNELSFMLDEQSYRDHRTLADVLVREYLDNRYLRLSLAGMMPPLDRHMAPMPFHWEKKKVSTPYPRQGRYGILDDEDLNAWRKVEGPFREMGFTIIRQLGIGQFGRVYEACNQFNPHIPRHVALKVDRIVRGKKKEAIQGAQETMQIASDLAAAPHVIRIFDAGKVSGKRYTFHVLQMVDGDTLDNLVGISGTEHSSMLRPRRGIRSEREVQKDYLKAIKDSTREIWRRNRMTRPFADPLDLSQSLDLMTSILIWLEEVHSLGYAVNDLKNGNLMISRRGQLKGIDLDAYSRIRNPLDRVGDFFFLAVSLILLLLNISRLHGKPMVGCEGALESPDILRTALQANWEFGDVAQLSEGRVQNEEVIDLLVDLIQRAQHGVYAQQSDQFSADIDRLIWLKRRALSTEIVLD